MRVASRHDIEAPPDFVFQALMDFDSWERSAMRRGADVVRTDKLKAVGVGLSWAVRFRFRGKERKLAITLTRLDAPSRLAYALNGKLFDVTCSLDLMELGTKNTRMVLVSEAKPKTLAARLMLQSLRLARARVQSRVEKRVGAIVKDIEERYRQKQQPRRVGPS